MNKRQIKKTQSIYSVVENMIGENGVYLGTQLLTVKNTEKNARDIALESEDEIEFNNGGNYPECVRTLTHSIYKETKEQEQELVCIYSITRDQENNIIDKTLYIYQ